MVAGKVDSFELLAAGPALVLAKGHVRASVEIGVVSTKEYEIEDAVFQAAV